MPTTVSTFTEDEITLRWRQPSFSAGINRKFATVVPRGTYRGFDLAPHPNANNTIIVTADERALDHALVYTTQDSYSITVRKSGGDFSIDIAPLVDADVEKTWAIAVEVNYLVGAGTTANIVAYEVAPTDELTTSEEYQDLVVLGTVTIPAANNAPLDEDNINPGFRTFAWENKATEAVTGVPQLRNSSFASNYWGNYDWELDTELSIVTTDPRSIYGHLKVEGNTGPITAYATQNVGTELRGEETKLRILLYKKVITDATGGTGRVIVNLLDAPGDSAATKTALTFDFDIQSVDAGYVELDFSTGLPTGVVYVDTIQVGVETATWAGGPVEGVYIDDFQVWTESNLQTRGSRSKEILGSLSLYGPSTGNDDADADAPRIVHKNVGNAVMTLLEEKWYENEGTNRAFRLYHQDNGDVWYTHNAYWSHADSMWHMDQSSSTVTGALRMGPVAGNVLHLTKAYLPNTWGMYEWDREIVVLEPNELRMARHYPYTFAEQGGFQFSRTYGPGNPSLLAVHSGTDVRYYIDWMGFPPHQLRKAENYWYHNPNGGGPWHHIGAGSSTTQVSTHWGAREIVLAPTIGCRSYTMFRWANNGGPSPNAYEDSVVSLRFQGVVNGASVINMGIAESNSFTDGYYFVVDSGTYGDTDIRCVSGPSGNTETTNSNVDMGVDDIHDFRIDIIGDNLETGFRAVYYIDEAEVANHSLSTTRITTNINARVVFYNTSGSNLYISPVVCQWWMPFAGTTWDPYA